MGFLKKRDVTDEKQILGTWKVLIVDDEAAIHDVTKLALKGFEFAQKEIEFLQAMSAQEAKEILRNHNDIALILLDVVMESDDAGLELVTFIRQEINNNIIRIILRTGQPGQAPEKYVIDHFDINDYKEKTELTQTKLYTCVRTGIQDYVRLTELQAQKEALSYLAKSAVNIFTIDSFENFFNHTLEVLTKFISLVDNSNTMLSDAFAVFPVDDLGGYKVCINCGKYCSAGEKHNIEPVIKEVLERIKEDNKLFFLDKERFVIPIKDAEGTMAIVFAFGDFRLNGYFVDLLGLMALQISISFKNIDLYDILSKDHTETINILAVASEYKDESTGEHIKRIENMTLLLALELGFSEEEATRYSRAAILHDIGKIAVPDSILQKPGKLDEEEMRIMRVHTERGKSILHSDKRFALEAEIALTHHEKYDGSGYPHGIQGEDIPLSGRMVSVVDVYDALVNARPYKTAWEKSKAIDYIKEEVGKQFDPHIVEAFVRLYESGKV
ncbi:MAG: HD domain-containing protein [Sulfuricurvum sp.]|uniref:response regulator n=1 Tax=Sulfuricurvum sp. TaxID=2025608 RepID=UPI002609EEF6|nr:response regulator [Sulfuricurvum sp.]MDD2829250.1 HD domain-containing protein [Sulfuricurvum sp.]MDD4949986.1 HD domain-containing protein [Sulfuricurvum sp.]